MPFSPMENFNDLIWERYQDTRLKLRRLEKRYFLLLLITVIEVVTFAFLYCQHFK